MHKYDTARHEVDDDFHTIADLLVSKGLHNVSYVNDACPSFGDDHYRIYVDRRNAEDREIPDYHRFCAMIDETDSPVVSSDNLAEVLKFLCK